MSINLNALTSHLTSHVTGPLISRLTELTAGPTPMAICPKAPPGATQPVNEITGYVVWGVIILFSLALIIGLGAIVAGRIFSMPHASKVGVISLVVVFVAAVAYLVLPGMLDGILGKGCFN